MKRITFYDGAAEAPYSEASLDMPDNGIGGAEATVARIALKLSEEHHVTVAQRGRQTSEGSARLRWIPLEAGGESIARADAIVVLRKPKHMVTVRRFNHEAPVFLWYHDWYDAKQSVASRKLRLQSHLKSETQILLHHLTRVKAIAVSQAHIRNIQQHLTEARALRPLASKVRVDYIYNPIPDALGKSDAPYDPTKLLYFSAPWKGLDLVLEAFQRVRRSMPDMRLYVASPGYTTADEAPAPGPSDNVTSLGRLAHADVLEQVRTALCVFYPANRVPESFGHVFAESHAVGTPVLAHPFGAACELLSGDELVDAEDIEAIVERIHSWRHGLRPVVSGNDQLRLSTVAAAWERLLLNNN